MHNFDNQDSYPHIYHIKLRSFNLTSGKLSHALSIKWQPAGKDAHYWGWSKGLTAVKVLELKQRFLQGNSSLCSELSY